VEEEWSTESKFRSSGYFCPILKSCELSPPTLKNKILWELWNGFVAQAREAGVLTALDWLRESGNPLCDAVDADGLRYVSNTSGVRGGWRLLT
jgi:hypothetical protein